MLKRIYFSKLNSTKLERMADIPMKNVTYRQFSEESYTEAQIKKGRPVSPHITIYKFPITAISSISNRATGIVLSIGITGIGALGLVGSDVPALMQMIGSVPIVAPIAKFSVAFPLVYHYFGGLRHIVWDKLPELCLTNEGVESSSYFLIGSSTTISLILAFLSF